jgi:uncharacterized membrane protein YfcA
MLSVKTKKIIKAIALFSLAFVSINFAFTKIATLENYIPCLIAFIVGTVIVSILFRDVLKDVISKTKKHEFLILLIPILIHGIVCYYCLNFLTAPVGPFENTETSFLLLNKYFIWVKPFDVLYQQIILIVLIKKLYEYKMNLKNITILFFVFFGTMHIFQIFRTDLTIALLFTLFGILGSFIFPYMILKKRDGYLYNYIIHMLVYAVAALSFWSVY